MVEPGEDDPSSNSNSSNNSSSANKEPKEEILKTHRAQLKVEKFTGTNNFGLWRTDVMDALVHLDLDEDLEEGKPDELTEKQWSKMNRLALASIRGCLDTPIRVNYQHETSARELWAKLEKEYLVKNVANRIHLKRNLYRFNMRKGATLSEHLDSFTKLLTDLINYDEVIGDEEKALCLINSLTEKYEPLITAIIHGKEALKYDEITSALRSEEFRKMDREEISKEEKERDNEVLMVKSRFGRKFGRYERSRGKQQTTPRNDDLEEDQCAFCLEKGHWKKDCPKLKLKKKSENLEANVARKDDSDVDSDYSLMASTVDYYGEEWILDSGCSCHICPTLKLFSNLTKFDHDIVQLGNGYSCQVRGIGTIKLKQNNGVIKELKDVRYIPSFKWNLISLGVLESSGLEIVMKHGTLKVYDEERVVIEGTRKGSLYILNGGALELGGDCTPQLKDVNLESTKNRRGNRKRIHKVRNDRRHIDRSKNIEGVREVEFGAAPIDMEGNTTIAEIEATKNIEPLNAQGEEVVCPIELRSPLGFRGIDVEQSPIESCVEVEIAFGWLKASAGFSATRSSHAIAVVGQKAYVFGGEFSPRVPVDNHLHVFDFQTLTWSIADASGDVPPPRVGVTMAAIGTTIYVFGGRDNDHNELNEFYSFDTTTNKWTSLSPGPAHRSYHSMTADDDRIYVFGGCGIDGRLNDLWAFDIKDNGWVKFPSPGESLKGRGGPGLAVSSSPDGRKKIWVVYGFAGQETDDVHCFDPVNQVWTQVETTGDKPNPRSVFSAAGIGQYIVVYGGEVDPSDLGHLGAGKFAGDGYALDTKTGVWLRWEDATEVADHPGPRGWCAYSNASIDGKDGLLVYGGNSPSNDRLDDLFFFTPSLQDTRSEVLQAWYMDDSSEDQRLPHHRELKEFVSLDQLAELGVLSWRLDADNYETDMELKKIHEDRGYTYTDFCEVCPEKLPNYEEKIKNFFEEHLHTDEEIRYCVAGSGYFDVRDKNEKWIRVWVKKGGLIVLPAGIYHRFTLDTNNYIKAMRLFVGEPVWTPYNRPHDELPARKGYIDAFVKKNVSKTAVGAAA